MLSPLPPQINPLFIKKQKTIPTVRTVFLFPGIAMLFFDLAAMEMNGQIATAFLY